MNDEFFHGLTLITAVGCGLVGGIFFAFSTFIMKALDNQPPAHGIAAMQSINVTVINPLFMIAFFGTGVSCVILLASALLDWYKPGDVFLLSGCLLYVIGTVMVTIVFNVPRNNSLAVVEPTSVEGTQVWTNYVKSWTAWNHVRTIAALLAATLLSLAL